jgi:hypothetical protein
MAWNMCSSPYHEVNGLEGRTPQNVRNVAESLIERTVQIPTSFSDFLITLDVTVKCCFNALISAWKINFLKQQASLPYREYSIMIGLLQKLTRYRVEYLTDQTSKQTGERSSLLETKKER